MFIGVIVKKKKENIYTDIKERSVVLWMIIDMYMKVSGVYEE